MEVVEVFGAEVEVSTGLEYSRWKWLLSDMETFAIEKTSKLKLWMTQGGNGSKSSCKGCIATLRTARKLNAKYVLLRYYGESSVPDAVAYIQDDAELEKFKAEFKGEMIEGVAP